MIRSDGTRIVVAAAAIPKTKASNKIVCVSRLTLARIVYWTTDDDDIDDGDVGI